MPCDSREEIKAIFDNVLQMDSFKNKMSQPKQANWFAWNKAAHEQIPEFWGTKMALESQLDDVDPDSIDGFAARNPSAQLVKLLKAGGGLRLAYKLMTESMHANVKIMKAGAWSRCFRNRAGKPKSQTQMRRLWQAVQIDK